MKAIILTFSLLVSLSSFSQDTLFATSGKLLGTKMVRVSNDVNDWTISSGTFVNGNDGKRNYIQCNADGKLYVAQSFCYGELLFEVYFTGTANIALNFCESTTNSRYTNQGYIILIGATSPRFFLRKPDGSGGNISLYQTATNTATASTWYKIKINRTVAGVTNIYIKGGQYADWTQVTAVSGSNPYTDNTYTSGSYLVIESTATCRFSNIRYTKLNETNFKPYKQ